VYQAKFNLPAWGGIVRATDWLKLRAGATKGADADTVPKVVGVAIRAENRGNLSRGIL